jgi:hypothetical protein
MTVETEVAALTSAVNLLTSTVNVSKATLDASVAAAEAAYDSFDDRYLGAKVSAPSLDNDGGSLLTGALYFNSTENAMYVYTGASWVITTNYNNVTAPYTLAQTLNTNGNNVTFGDNGKAIFGAGSDLQIYHDGSHSYIKEVGTGDLLIYGTNLHLRDASGYDFINCTDTGTGGTVTLFNLGSPKLATTSTGIDVTGTVTMDGLTSAGTILATSSTTINMILRGGDGNSKNLIFQKTTGSVQQAKISAVSDALQFFTGPTDERMRIDSSGNLLVGKAGTSISSTGIEAKADGQLWATRDGNPVLSLNRKTSDGSMAVFYKDGATVGSIGNFGDNLGIESVDVGLLFLSGSNQIVPTGGNFGVSDGTKDLGRSTTRFKNLYLSGGVVFGTTGGSVTSKTLDDYEEGTWTPVYAPTSGSFTTMTMSTPDCTYTKVGRMVTVSGIIRTNDVDVTGASGAVIISGLPFAVASWSAISLGRVQDFGGDMPDSGYGGGSATNINLYYRATSNGATSTLNVTDMQDGTVSSANYIFLEYTYQTT